MELVFRVIEDLKNEYVLKKLVNPQDGETTEFHYGRLTGMLFMLELLKQQLDVEGEAEAARRETAERNFDAA